MPVQTLTFAAENPDEAGGFGAYHDLYAGGSDVGLTGGRFEARVRAHRFKRMLVFDRTISGVIHRRDQARVRRDGFDHVALQLLLSGELAGGRPGEERALAPGEIILFDMTQPQATRADGARLITVSLARDVVEAVAPLTRSLHGAILPEVGSGLLGDFMVSLARRGDHLSAGTASRAGRAVAELLAAALGEGEVRPVSGSSAQQILLLRRERTEAYIETRLADPHLDVEAVAVGLGVSRSVLYRQFEASGGVAQHILHRRLERLRGALRRLGEVRSIATLAYDHGFASESHCSRAFRAAYGLPPGQYRAEMNRLRLTYETDEESSGGSFASWHSELY
ncbi:helix-turn-helix domain-containing protein [Phreatobacter stygius]|uniref:helix-turn-helix domain-containing protein n=1 Tax=Phreatobacter stygius TaxID=1940610 RepID=UPI001FE9DC8B|nr:helix-turn-helix domain-containing protein [Phreatobacter stygius]